MLSMEASILHISKWISKWDQKRKKKSFIGINSFLRTVQVTICIYCKATRLRKQYLFRKLWSKVSSLFGYSKSLFHVEWNARHW